LRRRDCGGGIRVCYCWKDIDEIKELKNYVKALRKGIGNKKRRRRENCKCIKDLYLDVK
jgi:hypothetical protein